jgi:glycosyltransferase involved in cell wall biosynthesis
MMNTYLVTGIMSENDLVTVVIPAFNAAPTIDETLCSVRSQTHRRLEIIVVDDGSKDATPQIVLRHAAEDRRIRLIRQPNAGVAAARNRAIAEAASDLVAPIDADDLWRPDKIEKQLAELRRGGEAVALVYTWSANIDETGQITIADPHVRHTGIVTYENCCGNFIGNGSAALMRKAAILEAGGYDPSLRARSGEGVEDWQLYFRISTRHNFAVVPEHLTGYRRLPTAMTTNVLQMLRGRDLLAEEMCARCPEWISDIRRERLRFLTYLYHHSLSTLRPGNASLVAVLLIRQSPLKGAVQVALVPIRAIGRAISRRFERRTSGERNGNTQSEPRQFLVGAPTSCDRDQSDMVTRS